ncbi:STAS domain-containing protein [Amycolatopsis aidingensis]|uniref:STAS domain-containing protein n=1 Tax=Amycolatopsis aidingensis TaxID=2842453 RepID=UPI001C0B6E2E|nr:STAS domain-containing protein [Amycolatopsis aidingensis]
MTVDTAASSVTHIAEDQVPRPRPANGTAQKTSPSVLRMKVEWPSPSTAVVRAWGELDMLTTPQFAELLGCRLNGTLHLLIIDLSGLDFFAVSGLAVLAHAKMRAEQRGIVLRVVTGQNHCVTRAFTATGLDRQLSPDHSISTAQQPA